MRVTSKMQSVPAKCTLGNSANEIPPYLALCFIIPGPHEARLQETEEI